MADPLDDLMAKHGVQVDPLDALMTKHGVQADNWQPTEHGFMVKPETITFNDLNERKAGFSFSKQGLLDRAPKKTVQTVRREDGALWFGPEQGNKGKPGWFDEQGHRLGDTPGTNPGLMGRLGNFGLDNFVSAASGEMAGNIGFGPYPTLGGIAKEARRIGNTLAPGLVGKEQSGVEKVIPTYTNAGVAKGLSNVVVAPAQLASHLTGGASAIDATANAIDNYYRGNFDQSKSGEMLGEALPFFLTAGASEAAQVPGAINKGAKALQYAKGVLKGAGVGAVAAPTLTPETNIQNEADYWNRKKQEMESGAKFGGALAASIPVAKWLGSKGANLLAGTKLGDLLGIKTQVNPKYAGAPELSKELDEAGIAHTVGDITSDPKILSQEAAMARRDPRMMDLRVKQNQEATAYAEKVLSDLKNAVREEGWGSLADVQAAVDANGKRSKEAMALLTAIENSGDDWKRIAQTSGKLKLFVEKLKADQLFDTATAIANQYGAVPTNATLRTSKTAINRLENEIGADSPNAPYMIKDIVNKLESGNTYTFGELRQLRSRLNNKISNLTDSRAVAPPLDVELNAYKDVVKAVEADLDKFAKSHSSGLRNSWAKATEHYKTSVVPYKDAEIGKILADQDPLALGRLFQGKDSYAQQRMYGLIGPKGQAAVRSGIIEDAILAGEKTQRGVGSPTMSCARAASALEKLDANGTMDIAFKGQEKWAAKGLARLLRVVDKSDTIAWIPPTGESLDRIGAAARGDLTALGVGQKAADWLNKERLFQLYTDPKGKALLIRASSLAPGSRAMNTLVARDIPQFFTAKTVTNANVTPMQTKTPVLPVSASNQETKQ